MLLWRLTCPQASQEELEALEADRERDRDIDERDALVERMMEKDKNKTKQAELGGLTPAQVTPCKVCFKSVAPFHKRVWFVGLVADGATGYLRNLTYTR